MTLPSRPYAWRGEASLAEIAHALAEADPHDTVLIAGCQVVVAQTGRCNPPESLRYCGSPDETVRCT